VRPFTLAGKIAALILFTTVGTLVATTAATVFRRRENVAWPVQVRHHSMSLATRMSRLSKA